MIRFGVTVAPNPRPCRRTGLGIELAGRLFDHFRREIDADEMIDLLGERSRAKPGAATQIDRALEEGGLLRGVRTDSTDLNNSCGAR